MSEMSEMSQMYVGNVCVATDLYASSYSKQAYRQNSTGSSVGVVFSDNLNKSGSYELRFPMRYVPSPELMEVTIGTHFYHAMTNRFNRCQAKT